MAKTAVMVRLSESEVVALDALAGGLGISRATCATSILRQRLGGSTPARLPTIRTEAEQDAQVGPISIDHMPPREASPPVYILTVDECEHKYELRGKCVGCGRVR